MQCPGMKIIRKWKTECQRKNQVIIRKSKNWRVDKIFFVRLKRCELQYRGKLCHRWWLNFWLIWTHVALNVYLVCSSRSRSNRSSELIVAQIRFSEKNEVFVVKIWTARAEMQKSVGNDRKARKTWRDRWISFVVDIWRIVENCLGKIGRLFV